MAWVFHLPYTAAEKPSLIKVPLEFLRHFSKEIWMKRPALVAFSNMRLAAKKEGVELLILSAWRGLEEQARLFEDAERRHGAGLSIFWVAPSGYSEHHTGYVIDVADGTAPQTDDEPAFEGTLAFRWLRKNGSKFGFRLSFPKENWQKISYEPWHWRYVGNEEASRIFYPPFYFFWLKVLRSSWKFASWR